MLNGQRPSPISSKDLNSTPVPVVEQKAGREGDDIAMARGGLTSETVTLPLLPSDTKYDKLSHLKTAAPELTSAHARLTILADFERWWSVQGGQLVSRLEEFAQLYNSRVLPDIPEWVYEHVPRCSRGSLHTWRRARDKAKDQAGRIAALVDRREANGPTGIQANQPLWAAILERLQERPHATVKALYRSLKCDFNDLPTLATVQRVVAQWKIDNPMTWAYWENPDAAKGKYEPGYGDMSATITRYLQLVELDSSPSDVHCIDGRYALIAAIDVFTRRVKVLVAKTSSGQGIATLMRQIFMDWGIPEVLKTDNGKDYTSNRITRLCTDIEIEHKLCPPFTPTAKPHVESFFKTLAHSYLFEMSTGFKGHNVAQAQAIRNQATFASRFMRRDKDQKNEAVEVALTAEQLQDRINKWLELDYLHNPHSGLAGLSPFEMLTAYQGPVRQEDIRKLDILLTDAPKTSGLPEGIRIPQADGLSAWGETYISAELVAWAGQQVRVRRDDLKPHEVIVWSLDWDFICVAEGTGGMEAQRQREIALDAKRVNGKLVRAIKGSLRKQPQDRVTPILAQAQADNGSLVALPHPSYSVETAALAGAVAAAEALDRARAPLAVSNPLSADEEAAYQRAIKPKATRYTDQEADRWDASDKFLNLRHLPLEQLTVKQQRWLTELAPNNAAVKGILRLEARANKD